MSDSKNSMFALRDIFRPEYRGSLLLSTLLLVVAYLVEHVANVYAFSYMARPTSVHVGDIFLDSIPAIDLNLLIVEGAFVAIVAGVLFTLSQPRYILFTLKALAIFIIIRAIFISLTHVGIHPDHIEPSIGFFGSVYTYLNFQIGFFFSGHTGLPFLMALIFWREVLVRNTFILMSVAFGAAVLFAHVHYSIDVFAAPFMAYGIFKITERLFSRDYALIARQE